VAEDGLRLVVGSVARDQCLIGLGHFLQGSIANISSPALGWRSWAHVDRHLIESDLERGRNPMRRLGHVP
jgi:hypothetical protein